MLVFDRGYNDYDWFLSLTEQKVNFVTRLKDNASWVVVETRPLAAGSNVRHDEIIVMTQHATEDNQRFFRRVAWWDEKSQREFVHLTNHLDLGAETVAAIYQARWQVELFFESINKTSESKPLSVHRPTLSKSKFGQHSSPCFWSASSSCDLKFNGTPAIHRLVAQATLCLSRSVPLHRSSL